MAMTAKAKENILNAKEIIIERNIGDNYCRVFVRSVSGAVSYLPTLYKSLKGARRAILRLNPTAPISEEYPFDVRS